MSQAEVDAIIAKAKSDSTYLKLLETNPKAALAGYTLTAAEIQQIQQALGIKLPQGRSVI